MFETQSVTNTVTRREIIVGESFFDATELNSLVDIRSISRGIILGITAVGENARQLPAGRQVVTITGMPQFKKDIIKELPENVYISFDIDGLLPYLCPNTGTPVAGGFAIEELIFLFEEMISSGRKIIGFDLCEVAPGKDQWDGNVGARVLYKLCLLALKSQKKAALT